MDTARTAIQLIQDYFAALRYPAIKEIKPCLMNEHGDVYLVSFEKRADTNASNPPLSHDTVEKSSFCGGFDGSHERLKKIVGIDVPNAYAIVTGDSIAGFKVTGYHEEFWVDADKYRLVLKQHLGLLVMEAEETAPQQKPSKAEQEQRDGYSKNATVDAIVERYEELLVKAEYEAAHTVSAAMEREAALTKQLIDAQTELLAAKTKFEAIKNALDSKGPSEEQLPSPEECMVRQGQADHLGDADDDAALVGEHWQDVSAYPVIPTNYSPTGGSVFVCKNGSQPVHRRDGLLFPAAINS